MAPKQLIGIGSNPSLKKLCFGAKLKCFGAIQATVVATFGTIKFNTIWRGPGSLMEWIS
jgi:hypothetical protein